MQFSKVTVQINAHNSDNTMVTLMIIILLVNLNMYDSFKILHIFVFMLLFTYRLFLLMT